jgi:hypothetical protein
VKRIDKKYVAFSSIDSEYAEFGTFEEAEKWLREYASVDGGYSEETCIGYDYIAKITHRSSFEETDRVENYHEHTEDCPEDCDEEEWPYPAEWSSAGKVTMKQVEEQ